MTTFKKSITVGPYGEAQISVAGWVAELKFTGRGGPHVTVEFEDGVDLTALGEALIAAGAELNR